MEQLFLIQFPQDPWLDEDAFGLQLIDIFTEQLDGEFKRETTNEETTYRFLLTDLDHTNNS